MQVSTDYLRKRVAVTLVFRIYTVLMRSPSVLFSGGNSVDLISLESIRGDQALRSRSFQIDLIAVKFIPQRAIYLLFYGFVSW